MNYVFDAKGRLIGESETRVPRSTNVAPPAGTTPAGTEWRFVDALQQWVALPEEEEDVPSVQMPTLVVTAVQADAEHAAAMQANGVTDITCPAGAVLTFSAELRDAEGKVLLLDDSFRMPVRARDGRERVVIAQMTQGIVTIEVPLRESGVWSADEETINAALPARSQMRFAGITVFAFDAV
jgi:hypothetical protein